MRHEAGAGLDEQRSGLVDKVFVINLARRPDRLRRIRERAAAAGLGPIEVFRAFDGLEMGPSFLAAHGVVLHPTWRDPTSTVAYHARDLKTGEIGCSLSHYFVWQRIVDEGIERALILEDDVVFAPHFAALMAERLAHLGVVEPAWELCYLGRRRLVEPPFATPPVAPEPAVGPGLVRPSFSYNTHAYAVSRAGAAKLLGAGMLASLIPVDEMIPALYARHPRADVRAVFGDGDRLRAFAVAPNLAEQDAESTDTERSAFIKPAEPPPKAALGLSTLLPGEEAARFLASDWPHRLHVAHGPLDRLPLPQGLFDLERVLRSPEVGVTLFGAGGFRASVANGADALAFHRRGETLYITKLERAFTALREICHALARDLDVAPESVVVEGFASRGGSGSSLHYDFDVNFNVQLRGTKTWRTAPNRDVENPLRSLHVQAGEIPVSPFDGRRLPAALPRSARRIEAAPGTVVFLPRGLWHETVANTDSFAIAFVIKPPTYFHLFTQKLANRLALDPVWRGYPIGADRRERFAEARRRLPEVLADLDADAVLLDLVRVRWAPAEQRKLDRLSRPKAGSRWALRVIAGEMETELPVADALVPVVRWMCERTDVFSADDAVAACPGTPPALAKGVIDYLLATNILERAR